AVKEMKKGNVYSKNFTIIWRAQVPSIHLAMGFLSNPTDRAYLTSEQGQNELARKLYTCLKNI
ncbi:MAG: N-acetylmuramoyl-L-alanine amidase, partial [Pasteurella sp.]|nr:N-acetylmuramoyl-L-alanine amidase [Pasteurella sp.]